MSADNFDKVADEELRRLERALSALDPDEVEADLGGDVLTLVLQGGRSKIIINRHGAARQIWMAAARQAWHFDRDAARGVWVADKGGEELWAALERVLSGQLGKAVRLTA